MPRVPFPVHLVVSVLNIGIGAFLLSTQPTTTLAQLLAGFVLASGVLSLVSLVVLTRLKVDK